LKCSEGLWQRLKPAVIAEGRLGDTVAQGLKHKTKGQNQEHNNYRTLKMKKKKYGDDKQT
jgi:hypothetical protein